MIRLDIAYKLCEKIMIFIMIFENDYKIYVSMYLIKCTPDNFQSSKNIIFVLLNTTKHKTIRKWKILL